MKGMRSLYFFILIIFFGLNSFGQTAKYRGDIVYRLSQYVTWPEKNSSYKFVIGVVGNINDFESFQELALRKGGFHNNPIEVRYFECTEKIDDCQLLYISEECKIGMQQIMKKTKNHPILIVAGKEGYGELGAVINFVETEGKLRFELNEQQANKRGLQVSERLMDIAIII